MWTGRYTVGPQEYMPTVPGWSGRTGRVESIVPAVYDEYALTPDNAIAYICGNPDMIATVEQTLLDRGFPEAQVKKEMAVFSLTHVKTHDVLPWQHIIVFAKPAK